MARPRRIVRVRRALGDTPAMVGPMACPPGYTLNNGVCGPPQPSWFQRVGAALTGFFNAPASTGLPPGYVPPQPSFTQSPMFLPVLIGGGIVVFMLLKKD